MFLNHYQTTVKPLCLNSKCLLYGATESISINPKMKYLAKQSRLSFPETKKQQ